MRRYVKFGVSRSWGPLFESPFDESELCLLGPSSAMHGFPQNGLCKETCLLISSHLRQSCFFSQTRTFVVMSFKAYKCMFFYKLV